jgi:hypothetical protein
MLNWGNPAEANVACSLSRLRERGGERVSLLGRTTHALSLTLSRKRERERAESAAPSCTDIDK